MGVEVHKGEASVSNDSDGFDRGNFWKFIINILFLTIPDYISSCNHRHLLFFASSFLIVPIVVVLTPNLREGTKDRKVSCHGKGSALLSVSLLLIELSSLLVLVELSVRRMVRLLLEYRDYLWVLSPTGLAFVASASFWEICDSTLQDSSYVWRYNTYWITNPVFMYDTFTFRLLGIPATVTVNLVACIFSLLCLLFLRIEVVIAAGLVQIRRHLDFCFCDSSLLLSESNFAVQVLYWKEEYRLLWILPQKIWHFQWLLISYLLNKFVPLPRQMGMLCRRPSVLRSFTLVGNTGSELCRISLRNGL